MGEQRYLRKVKGGDVYAYTAILANRSDMVECDAQGNLVSGTTATRQEVSVPKTEGVYKLDAVVDALTGEATPVVHAPPAEEISFQAEQTAEQLGVKAGAVLAEEVQESAYNPNLSDQGNELLARETEIKARMSQMKFKDIRFEIKKRFNHALPVGMGKDKAIETYIELDRRAT